MIRVLLKMLLVMLITTLMTFSAAGVPGNSCTPKIQYDANGECTAMTTSISVTNLTVQPSTNVAPIVISTSITTFVNLSFSSYTLKEFSAYYDSARALSLAAEPIVAEGDYSISVAPYLSFFPLRVSPASAMSRDFSMAGEIDFVACDPSLYPDCLNAASGGLAQNSFANYSPLFGTGQANGQHSSTYALSVFGAPGRYPDYQIWMQTEGNAGPYFIPVDVSTSATVLSLFDSGSTLSLAPSGGKVSVGGLSNGKVVCYSGGKLCSANSVVAATGACSCD